MERTAASSAPIGTVGSGFAMLVAAAEVPRFAPTIRLHDRGLFELHQLAARGELTLETGAWRFVPSPNGGYALVGLSHLLLILSEEGWLTRSAAEAMYIVSTEFRDRGARDLAALSGEERRRVRQVARRWKARASVSAKNAA